MESKRRARRCDFFSFIFHTMSESGLFIDSCHEETIVSFYFMEHDQSLGVSYCSKLHLKMKYNETHTTCRNKSM